MREVTAQDEPLRLPVLPDVPFDYDAELPAYLLENNFGPEFTSQNAAIDNDNTPADNPVTDAGATLGRVLFYDRQLSANQTTSCASCHLQAAGFSDPEIRSIGLSGGRTSRHSMSLVNARFFEPGTFFWDTRAPTLEDQVLEPIVDPLEMDMPLDEAVAVVGAQDYYPPLFEAAFGDESVSTERISLALAQFIRSMVSVDSEYDRGRVEVDGPLEPFPNFSTAENAGKDLFFTGGGRSVSCASCHVSEAFVNRPEGVGNNGLDFGGGDFGAFMVTNDEADLTRFKVPSLRSIARSAPYMHDGRFPSLEAVVQHYSSSVRPHPSLSEPLRNPDGSAFLFQFTQVEGDSLVAFLNTLTDDGLATSEKWADPFTGEVFEVASASVGPLADESGGASPVLVFGGLLFLVVAGTLIRWMRRR
ncbi:MAG: cytochrome-c peroxidase [Actinobacteria bacterium]|nr:cytochrome-c peroxidase [Actinomycetota bacterium]